MNPFFSKSQKIDELYDNREYQESLDLVNDCIFELEKKNLESAQLFWRKCTCLDMLGDHLEAFRFAEKAILVDPFCLYFHSSKDIILDKLEDYFVELTSSNNDKALDLVFNLLHENGRATDKIYLARAQYAIRRKELAQAQNLIDKLIERNPNYPGVITIKERMEKELVKEESGLELIKKAQ